MAKSANQTTKRKAKLSTKKTSAVEGKKALSTEEKTSAAVKKKSIAGYERVFEQIYRLVLRIPAGKVMTYGQIARLLDDRYSPRLVGWAMHATPKDERNIPWHRVINSRGATSTGRLILHEPDMQRLLLENEGVTFNDKAVCDLKIFQWSPAKPKTKAKETSKAGTKTKAKSAARKIGKKE